MIFGVWECLGFSDKKRILVNLVRHKFTPEQEKCFKKWFNGHIYDLDFLVKEGFIPADAINRILNVSGGEDIYLLNYFLAQGIVDFLRNYRYYEDRIYIHGPIGSPAFWDAFKRFIAGYDFYYYLVYSHSERKVIEEEGKETVFFEFEGVYVFDLTGTVYWVDRQDNLKVFSEELVDEEVENEED